MHVWHTCLKDVIEDVFEMLCLFFFYNIIFTRRLTDVTALRIESNVARTIKRESAKSHKAKSYVLPVGIER